MWESISIENCALLSDMMVYGRPYQWTRSSHKNYLTLSIFILTLCLHLNPFCEVIHYYQQELLVSMWPWHRTYNIQTPLRERLRWKQWIKAYYRCVCHIQMFLESFALSRYCTSVILNIYGHQYPGVKALWARLQLAKWFLYTLVCISLKMVMPCLLVAHLSSGVNLVVLH